MNRVDGRLRLDFNVSPSTGETVLAVLEAQPPLKVIRAFEVDNGASLVHLHNVSGGILGGDLLTLGVRVGPEARAQLTTTSATRIYRRRSNAPDSSQVNGITVCENAVLEMLPDPLIPFAGSAYKQQTRIDLEDGAGLFWWETVAPGREARGEMFAYDRLSIGLEIWACGKPIALELALLEPKQRPLSSPARLGGYTYFSTFYICRVGLPASTWAQLEGELTELATQISRPGTTIWGVSTLVAHGLAIRALSKEGHAIAPGLLAFWNAAKRALYGRDAVPPRKIY